MNWRLGGEVAGGGRGVTGSSAGDVGGRGGARCVLGWPEVAL